jgi:hypothetical protein
MHARKRTVEQGKGTEEVKNTTFNTDQRRNKAFTWGVVGGGRQMPVDLVCRVLKPEDQDQTQAAGCLKLEGSSCLFST